MLVLQNHHLRFKMKTRIGAEEERGCWYRLWLDYALLCPFASRSEQVSLRAFCFSFCSCCQVMSSQIQGLPKEKVNWCARVECYVATCIHVCACVCMHGCVFVWVHLCVLSNWGFPMCCKQSLHALIDVVIVFVTTYLMWSTGQFAGWFWNCLIHLRTVWSNWLPWPIV